MKKITFMLALLGFIFTSVQSAFATDEKWVGKKIATVSAAIEGLDNLTDGYYLLRNVGRQTFLRENDGKGLYLWNATNGSEELATVQAKFVNSSAYMSSVVYVAKKEGSDKYTMQFKSGQYLGTSLPHGGAASSNATAGEIEFAALGSSQFAFRPTDSEWANGNGDNNIPHSEGTFTGWETKQPGAGGNGAYQLFPVTLAEVTTVTCTWTVKAGENTLGTFTTEVDNGTVISELPTMPEMSYFYTNPTLVTPENNVVSTDNCNFTINVDEADAPYTASTAANPTWYTIKLRNDDTHYICHVLPTDNNIGSHRPFTAEFCKNQGKLQTYEGFFWAFVKDGFGVKLLNKQTGKYVKASGQNAATLDANGTTFIVKTNTNNNSIGFSLQIPGSANIHIGDHVHDFLGGWNSESSQNDNGSCLQIALATTEASLAVGKEVAIDTLSNFAVVEANKTMATARTQASVDAAKAAVEAATTFDGIFNACNMVYVPAFEADAYYRIQNINSITKKYLTSAPIFVGKDGSLSTSYHAGLSGNREIRRVADDANFVSQLWQLVSNGNGTYKIKNANTGCRMSSYVPHIDMPIDVNGGGNYTLKVVPTTTFNGNDGTTMLQMVVDNHIINAFSGDQADYIAAYDVANDKGGYWQFVKVTDVPVEISAANYATVGFPFAVEVPAESGIKAFYVSSIADGKMELTEFENGIIPANTGAILYHDGATTANLAITTTTTTATVDNKLTATTAKRVGYDAESTYVLALNGEGNAAFLKSNLTSVPANKAYVSADQVTEGEGAAAVLNFVFGGTTTAINGVEANNGNNVEYYDLNGRRVLYPANGIFVTNAGKKVFIK